MAADTKRRGIRSATGHFTKLVATTLDVKNTVAEGYVRLASFLHMLCMACGSGVIFLLPSLPLSLMQRMVNFLVSC
jgi:hypothetical protein